jgi:hypothetical protein
LTQVSGATLRIIRFHGWHLAARHDYLAAQLGESGRQVADEKGDLLTQELRL